MHVNEDAMIDPALKEYMDMVIVAELRRLSTLVTDQGSALKNIEISTSRQITELSASIRVHQEEIDHIKEDVNALADQVRRVGDSQKFNWKTLSEERKQERDAQARRDQEQAKKDQDQALINQTVVNLNTKIDRAVWLIASTITLIIIYGIAELIMK